VKVEWSAFAVEQLANIHDYLARNSTPYALRVVDRLLNRSEQIGVFPHSGRVTPEFQQPQVREVLEGTYRIIYRILSDRVEVITVVHQAQRLDSRNLPLKPDV
jgi:toxin ParE1/3/4